MKTLNDFLSEAFGDSTSKKITTERAIKAAYAAIKVFGYYEKSSDEAMSTTEAMSIILSGSGIRGLPQSITKKLEKYYDSSDADLIVKEVLDSNIKIAKMEFVRKGGFSTIAKEVSKQDG